MNARYTLLTGKPYIDFTRVEARSTHGVHGVHCTVYMVYMVYSVHVLFAHLFV